MIQRRSGGDQRGLTLIELVLALTILAIAGSLVSGAFATGLRAWRSGLRSGREELVARIVLERIATQLRAAVASPALRGNEKAISFDAGDDYLRFVTLAGSGAAPVQVFYGLLTGDGGMRLVYREHPWPDKEFFSGGRPRREERVAEVKGFSVKAFRGSEGSDAGVDQPPVAWNRLDQTLPASVSVEIVVPAQGEPEPRRYQILVPLLAHGGP